MAILPTTSEFQMKKDTPSAKGTYKPSGKGMFYDAFTAMGLDMTPETADEKLEREIRDLKAQKSAILLRIARLEAAATQLHNPSMEDFLAKLNAHPKH